MRRTVLLFIPAILLGVAACSSESPTAPDPTADETVIGVDGGRVEAASDGVAARLEFPAGAVLDDVEVSLVPQEGGAGERAHFTLQPAGLLLRAPATLTLTLPDGENAGRWTVMLVAGAEAVPMPASTDGRVMTVELRSLGFFGEAGKRMDLSVVLQELDCALQLESFHQRILSLQAWTTSSGGPSLLASEIGALLQQIEVLQGRCSGEPNYAAEIQFLQTVSCETYESAATDVQVVAAPNTIEEFDAQLAQVFAGQAMVQMSGVDCGPAFGDLLTSESTDFVTAYDDRISQPGFFQGLGTWTAMWNELRLASVDLNSRLALMGLEDSEQILESVLLPNIYSGLHELAYEACGDDNTQVYLADLLTAGFYRGHPINASPNVPHWAGVSSTTLLDDIQYCASSLMLEVFDAVSDPVASYELGGSETSGTHVFEQVIPVPVDGFIDLRGPIHAFFCAPPGANANFESDQLTLTINGVTQGTFAPINGAMLTNTQDLSIAQVLETLGLNAVPDQTMELVIQRESPACNGMYAVSEHDLFRLELVTEGECAGKRRDGVPCGGQFVEIVGLPDRVSPGETHSITLRAGVDVDGTVEYQEGIEIDIRVFDGTTTVASGVSDANGELTASVTMREEQYETDYVNELRVEVTARFPTGDAAATKSALRPNAIVYKGHSIQVEAESYFFYDPSAAPGAEIVFNEDADSSKVFLNMEAFGHTLALDESGTGADMSARGKIESTIQSTVGGSASAFSGATLSSTSAGFIQLSNPNFDVRTYSAYVRARSEGQVSFWVYGDPATFTVSGSQTGTPNGFYVWIFGPGEDPYECTGDDGPCAIGGSGMLRPGRYTFVTAFHKFSSLSWCENGCEASSSGTVGADANLSATLNVTH